MLFQANITIPKSTTAANPTTVILPIAHGIISQIMVRPRAGHQHLAHLTILHHEHQIAPSTEGMSITGDFFPVDWVEYYESYQPPYALKLRGWNDDDTYAHTFTVYVAILPRKGVVATSITDMLKSILGLFFPRMISVKPPEE